LRCGCQTFIKQRKAEADVAVTHLALARRQKAGTGILGYTKEKKRVSDGSLFYVDKRSGVIPRKIISYWLCAGNGYEIL